MEQTPRIDLVVLPGSRKHRVDIVCRNDQSGMVVHFASWQTLINIMTKGDAPTRPPMVSEFDYNVSIRAAEALKAEI